VVATLTALVRLVVLHAHGGWSAAAVGVERAGAKVAGTTLGARTHERGEDEHRSRREVEPKVHGNHAARALREHDDHDTPKLATMAGSGSQISTAELRLWASWPWALAPARRGSPLAAPRSPSRSRSGRRLRPCGRRWSARPPGTRRDG